MTVNGESIARGTGADALGHPLRVLHVAASVALAQGNHVAAGELVITGTCTGVVDGTAGSEVVARHGEVDTTVVLR